LVSILLNINYFWYSGGFQRYNGYIQGNPGTGENIWTGNIYFFMVSILLNINYFWYSGGFLLI